MKEYAKEFYSSAAWKKTREAYARSVGFLCEECLKRGKIVPYEIVHHKIHITPGNINDPRVTLSFDNLEALCRECHAVAHGARQRRYSVDEFGHISPL